MLVPRETTPNSIYDIFVRASDDLGNFTDSATLTVTRGGPCTGAEGCLPNQDCLEGRCTYPPSVGEFGDACEFPQYCKSLLCEGNGEVQICTQSCESEDPEGCPAGMSCQGAGVCFFADDGGCCSSSRDSWMGSGLLAMILGFLLRPGRRKRRPAR
jgi:hypothetical protein